MGWKEGWIKRRKNNKDVPWNKGKRGLQIAWNKGKNLKEHPTMGFQKGHKDFLIGDARKKSSENHKGEKHPNWKGGITPLLLKIRNCFKTRQWRSDVFQRDNFICQECGIRGNYLEAHHIKEFSKIIEENKIITFELAENCEELWNINNGITLCKDCHKKTDNFGQKANKKIVQYTA
jgi:hypothetical protein